MAFRRIIIPPPCLQTLDKPSYGIFSYIREAIGGSEYWALSHDQQPVSCYFFTPQPKTQNVMTKRAKVVAGNWKMHLNHADGVALAEAIVAGSNAQHTTVVLCTPAIHLQAVAAHTHSKPGYFTGAQNCHYEAQGAFTGELSLEMLASVGTTHVIIGHSERREYFGETSAMLAKKVDAVLAAGMTPIYCCGEPLEIREAGHHIDYVGRQLQDELFHLDAAALAKVVIAYEPIWAIGTGVTASPEQAQETHAALRGVIAAQYGESVADTIPILYGGSVKPDNAATIFACPDVDGGLVGGASLKPELFIPIIEAMEAHLA